MAYIKAHFDAWSFSRYNLHRECPRKAKYANLDKIPEEKGPALERGALIHDLARDYLRGYREVAKDPGRPKALTRVAMTRLPKELALYAYMFKSFRAFIKLVDATDVESNTGNAYALEEMWVLRKDWSTTVWNDWTNVWARIKLDFCTVQLAGDEWYITVWDWKTGKFREEKHAEYVEQLDLYKLGALVLYAAFGAKMRVRAKLVYLDIPDKVWPEDGSADDVTVTPKDLKRLKTEWEKRIKPMMNDRTFAPRPGSACKFCSFKKERGGPCQF